MRSINEAGLALIKRFEGCSLTVYRDIIGIATVGFGHVTNLPVGSQISLEEAESLLKQDLTKFETGVEDLLETNATDNQFSALVCFAFNVGLGNLKYSHLLAKFNAGNAVGASKEFVRWDRAGGKVIPGLLARREAESQLFLS